MSGTNDVTPCVTVQTGFIGTYNDHWMRTPLPKVPYRKDENPAGNIHDSENKEPVPIHTENIT